MVEAHVEMVRRARRPFSRVIVHRHPSSSLSVLVLIKSQHLPSAFLVDVISVQLSWDHK